MTEPLTVEAIRAKLTTKVLRRALSAVGVMGADFAKPEVISPMREVLVAALAVPETHAPTLEERRVAAYRQARIFEPNMDCYHAAMAVYAAAFGKPDGEPTVILPDGSERQGWEIAHTVAPIPHGPKEQEPETPAPIDLSAVTRLEVIDEVGRVYSRWDVRIDPELQDDGRTLKLFVSHRRPNDLA